MVEHFVAGIQQRPQGQIDRFGDADRNEDFGERFIGNLKMPTHIVGDRAAKPGQPEIRGVASASALQGENRRLANVPRRREIRLPDAQRDDIVHRLDDFEKVANARARDVTNVVGDGDTHGDTESRSEVGSKRWNVPFSL